MPKNNAYLVITELFLPTKGGTAVWFDEVYRRLGGRDIHIVTAAVPDAEAYDAQHANSVHRVNLQRHPWLRPESLFMYLKLLLKALGLALSHRFEAVHAGRVLPEGFVAWLVSRIIRKPLVIYAHGEEITTWREPNKFKLMRFTYRHAEVVIANSEFTRQALLDIGVAEERIQLINPGVDIERYQPGLTTTDLREQIGISESQPLILSVGRLSRRKGFDRVVGSLAALMADGLDVHYALIGIGEDREYLEDLAAQHDVADRIHFLGHVSMDDLPRWYNACDLFTMPNREINGDTEGFGMVFIEASACGKPVVAGQAGGTGSSVVDELTGIRVDGESPAAVQAALHKMLTDKTLAQRLGDQGRQYVTDNFSWDLIAQKTQGLHRE